MLVDWTCSRCLTCSSCLPNYNVSLLLLLCSKSASVAQRVAVASLAARASESMGCLGKGADQGAEPGGWGD